MSIQKTILAFCFSTISIVGFGQTVREIPCHTDERVREQVAKDPGLLLKQAEYEDELYNHLYNTRFKAGQGCEVRIIPTVFHIIHDNGSENISDATVHQYVQKVNETYRFENVKMEEVDTTWRGVVVDMNVELRLAQIDPNGNKTNGIVRIQSSTTANAGDNIKALSMWDPNKYLNIWVVRTISGSTPSSTILGYAYFPWMESSTNSGIVIRSDVLNRATLPHELGHYLNLYHPFEGSCGIDCRNTGDLVCDTPPSSGQNFGCPRGRNSCSNDSPDLPDQIENIMDYSDCRTIFTRGQKARVDYTLEKYRKTLVSRDNLLATGVLDSNETLGEPIADFQNDKNVVCEGSSVQFTDFSCTDVANTEYKWLFPSGVPSVAFEPNPKVSYASAGLYDVTLIISNKSGADTLIVTSAIMVLPSVATLKAPYRVDFESDDFPYAGWKLHSKDSTYWQRTTEVARSGTASLWLPNFGNQVGFSTYTFSTPPIDLTASQAHVLSFDLAYALQNSGSREILEIYAIDACRGVELLRLSNSGASLRTVSEEISDSFTPTADQWKNIVVNMAFAKSLTAASIKFKFTSYGEQNIFIDNIIVGSDWSMGLQEQGLHGWACWPNPARDAIHVQGPNSASAFSWKVLDLYGREVGLEGLGTLSTQVGISSLAAGVYFIQIANSESVITLRFAKE